MVMSNHLLEALESSLQASLLPLCQRFELALCPAGWGGGIFLVFA